MGVPDDAPVATIGDVLADWATRRTNEPLLIAAETGRQCSFAELAGFTDRLNAWLDTEGIAPGARVALFLNNGLAMSALFLGVMACARVVTPINLLAQRSQLAYVLEHCEAEVLVTSDEHRERITEALGTLARAPRTVYIDPDGLDWPPTDRPGAARSDTRGGRLAPPRACATDDTALIMYTSGTTGKPKGAMLSHHNLLHAAGQVARWHGLTPHDRVLSALPLYHINGQVIATLAPFLSGGSIVCPRRFSASNWWQDVARYRCTWINMVPTIVAYLLNHSDDPAELAIGQAACQTVRFGRSASAPLPAEHQQRFEQRFGVPLIEAMGMTESASVVFCNPMPPQLRKSGTPGVPVGIEARIVDRSGQDLPDGQQGEIWFRGPNVMLGYFKSPEQTHEAIGADGWLRTGDLGHRDPDGYYFVTGRLKELIIKGGENIAPREIDEALLRHPAVLEAAAVGIPHANYGQDILACVVLREGQTTTADELQAFCRDELGPYKTPAQILIRDALPKGPSGKIQRMKLLDPAD